MRTCRTVVAVLIVVAGGLASGVRADLFWDGNGSLDGATETDVAPGTWGSDSFWSGDFNGLTSTGPWVADETAVFAAGNDATGTYTVNVTGTQQASGLKFEEGLVTLSGGTVNLTNAATVSVTSNTTATINSVIGGTAGLTVSGATTLIPTVVLGGANTYTGETVLAANASAGTFNTLRLGASNVIPDGSVVRVAGANSNFDVFGFSDTVRSITGGGTNSRIDLGAGTLTIADQTGDNFTFSSQIIAPQAGKIIKNGPGQINLGGSSASFDGEFVLNEGTLGIVVNNFLGGAGNGTAKLTLNGGTLVPSGAATSRSVLTRNIDIGGSFAAVIAASNVELLGGTQDIGGVTEGTTIITLKVDNPTISVSNSTGGGIFIFRGALVDGGNNRGFTKAGPGTLLLNHPNNTYGGDTTVAAGQLRFDATASLGDGTGTINLAGGNLAVSATRELPIVNAINMTANAVIATTRATVDATVNADFTTSSIAATAGTLTFRNEAVAGGALPANQFEPQFSGSGFNFSRPIVIAAGLLDATNRTTRFNSGNATGTQTYSGVISGPGKFRRTSAGGDTVFTAANTFTGGTEVAGGTLTISGSTATAGGGNVTVTGGTLVIASGVTNAIEDVAGLSISGTGQVNLGAGISEAIAALSLGGVVQTALGTYGAPGNGGAQFTSPFISGAGVVRLTLPGDFNLNNVVGDSDFTDPTLGFNARFGSDLDGGDFLLLQQNYGRTSLSTPVAAGVPEPGSLALAAFAAAAIVGRVRGRRRCGA